MKTFSIEDGHVVGSDKTHFLTTWEKGGVTYSELEAELPVLPPGGKLGNILEEWTKCSMGCMNGTCCDAVFLEICGINNEPGTVFTSKIALCTLGITDEDDCPLDR